MRCFGFSDVILGGPDRRFLLSVLDGKQYSAVSLCLSNLTDLMKMVIFHGFERPGCRKSDSGSKNDSFWRGARLRTCKIGLFHILVHICPLPVTIGVCLSIACHYRRIFVHCLSLSAYICRSPGLKCYRSARLGGPQL